MGLREQFYDLPFSEDYGELSRGEMLRNRVSWDYRDTVAPAPVDSFKLMPISLEEIHRAGQAMSGIQTQLVPQELYHGFSKPPEPAKPYPGSYAYPVMYGLCALLAITGVGGLWWMVT